MLLFVFLSLVLLHLSRANVEKIIFLGPVAGHLLGSKYPGLTRLTPKQHTVRTQLHSKFEHSPSIPSIPSETWYILDGLVQNARYEVRICWPATQPTAFDLDIFTEEQIRNKGLMPMRGTVNEQNPVVENARESPSSWLLLKVDAKADFFTTNSTLMHDGLVVDIDLILDPYLLNIFPNSLLATGLHILAVAGLAIVAVRLVLQHLDSTVAAGKVRLSQGKKKA